MSDTSAAEKRIFEAIKDENILDGAAALTQVLFNLIEKFPPDAQLNAVEFIRKACDEMKINTVN